MLFMFQFWIKLNCYTLLSLKWVEIYQVFIQVLHSDSNWGGTVYPKHKSGGHVSSSRPLPPPTAPTTTLKPILPRVQARIYSYHLTGRILTMIIH